MSLEQSPAATSGDHLPPATWVRVIERIHSAIAGVVMWACLLLVLWQFVVIILQHVFGFGIIWMQELLLYLHAFMFMGTVSYLLAVGGQVRIDIYYARFSPRTQALVDLCSYFLLILPFAVIVLYFGITYVIPSWRVLEGATELEGIPLMFVLKTLIPLLGLSLALQALALGTRALTAFRRASHDHA